jgi:hypothetical protein
MAKPRIASDENLKLNLRTIVIVAIVVSLILLFFSLCGIINKAWLSGGSIFSYSSSGIRNLLSGLYNGIFWILRAFVYLSFFLIARRYDRKFLKIFSLAFMIFSLFLILDLILISPIIEYLSVDSRPYDSTLLVISVSISILFGIALIKLNDLSDYAFFAGILIIAGAASSSPLISQVFLAFALIAQTLLLVEIGLGKKVEI